MRSSRPFWQEGDGSLPASWTSRRLPRRMRFSAHTELPVDIRELKYFIELAKVGNIDKAALRLRISTRTLFRLVHTLQEEAGTPLLAHAPKGLALTEGGRTFLEYAYKIVASMESLVEDVQRIGQQELKRLEIAVYGSAMFNAIPELHQAFRKAHPDIDLVVHTLPPEQQIEALRQGRIEMAFDRYLQPAPDLRVELVIPENHVVAVPQTHELAKLSAIHVSDLRDYPFIGCNNPNWYGRFDKWFKPYGFEFRTTVQKASNVMSAVALVSAGFGITLAPAFLQTMSFRNVVFRPLLTDAAAPITFDLHCAYLRDNPSPLVAALLETVRAYRDASEMVQNCSSPSVNFLSQ